MCGFVGGEIFPDNRPEFIVNFPEGHIPEYYLRDLIDLGRPHIQDEKGNFDTQIYKVNINGSAKDVKAILVTFVKEEL
jgi:phosphoribosylformylglycinamidine (FGAM) synthase-like amidotransferase family enzyme